MASSISIFNQIAECTFKEYKNIRELKKRKTTTYKTNKPSRFECMRSPTVWEIPHTRKGVGKREH